jgi:hypothetical protein
MRRFEGVTLTTVLAVAAAVTGCHKDNDWQASAGPTRVCVDASGARVPEAQCAPAAAHIGGVNPFVWYYLGTLNSRPNYVPPYGGYVSGGSLSPARGVNYSAAPAGGISRGGFGGGGRG